MLVALREQGDGVPIGRSMQIGVEFTRGARPEPLAQFESLCAVQEPSGHRAKPQCVAETPPTTSAVTATTRGHPRTGHIPSGAAGHNYAHSTFHHPTPIHGTLAAPRWW